MQLTLEIFRSVQAGDPFAFRGGMQEYVLRTALGGAENAQLDWDESLLADLASVRRPDRDAEVVQRLAERLRRFLSATSFALRELEMQSALSRGESVQLTLRFAAAELFALPWELLSLGESGQFLGAQPGVLLRYAWPETTSAKEFPEPRREGGRVLLAWSAAAGAVPAAEHREAIARACQIGHQPFDEADDVLPHCTYAKLAARLQDARADRPIAVLHLLCHGVRKDATFGLALSSDDDASESDVIDAVRLRQLLAPHAGQLRLVVLAACDSANSGALGNLLGSLAQSLHRAGIAVVIGSRFPLSANGSVSLCGALYESLLVRLASLEDSFIAARQKLLAVQSQLDWAALQLYARPEDGADSRPFVVRPYRGLEPFLASHSRFLFGRERERQQARQALLTLSQNAQPRFLVVAGASGTGKSSVVLGGLVPDLIGSEAGSRQQGAVRRALAELHALLDERNRTPAVQAALVTLRDQLATAPIDGPWEWAMLRPGGTPMAALDHAMRSRRDVALPFLLCVDQFEEIFTHASDAALREAFARRLWALAKEPTGIHVVITLRVDFLGHCGELVLDESGLRLDRIAYAEAHRVFVAQLEPAQLAHAIVGPAQLVGIEIAPSLSAQMVSEVEGEPGALPLLEYVLDLLWQQREGNRLSERVYAELGGVTGALGRNADRVFGMLAEDDQRLARQLLIRLVHLADKRGDETRRRVPLRRLREQIRDEHQRLDFVLAEFVDARLLVRSEEAGQAMVEVAHEALIRKWRRLSAWLVEDRQRLSELHELEQWAEQHAAFGTRLRGSQLGYAVRILKKHSDDLGPQIVRMIRDSLAAQRRLRLLVSTAILIALCALSGLSLVARAQKQQAMREREAALNKERIAASRLLAMRAEKVLQAEPDLGLLLAGHAYSMHREFSSRSVLFAALDRTRYAARFLRGPHGRVPSLTFSPDGDRLAATSIDAGVFIYDTHSGELRAQLRVPEKTPLHAAMWSPDGRALAAGNSGHVYLWNAHHFERPAEVLPAAARTIFSVGFSEKSDMLAAGTEEGHILLWDVASRRALESIDPEQTQIVSSLKFLAERADANQQMRLLIGGSSGSVALFDVATRKRIIGPLPTDRGVVSSVAGSPDGKLVAAASEDRAVLLWDSESGTPHGAPLIRHESAVSCVRFSPDGKLLASFGIDRAIHLWDVETAKAIGAPLRIHAAPIYSCAFGRKQQLASGSDDLILLWDVTNHPALRRSLARFDISAMAVDANGLRAMIGGTDGHLRSWDLSEPQPDLRSPIPIHRQAINAVAFSANGQRVISGGGDGEVRISDARTLVQRQHLRAPGHGPVMTLAPFSQGSSDEILAAGYADGTIALWNLRSGQPIAQPIAARQQSITALAWTPNGDALISGGLDGSIRLWERSTLAARCSAQPLHGDAQAAHEDAVSSLSVHPQGQLLASAGRDRRIVLWNLPNGESGCITQLAELPPAHSGGVTALKWSVDGQRLASGGEDSAVALWDLEARQLIGQPLRGHLSPITGLAFDRDGLLISADEEIVQRWDTDEARWPMRACARANRNLSQTEWRDFLGERPYCRTCAGLPAGIGAPLHAPACTQ